MNICTWLFAAIFFASKAGKKGFPLLSLLGSTVNLFSSFINAIDCAVDIIEDDLV